MSETAAGVVRWRIRNLGGRPTARRVVDSMSVEELPYGDVPPRHRLGLVAFRHLRTDAREALVARVLEGVR